MTPSTKTLNKLLETAVGHHRSGRLQDAEIIYRRVLEIQPNQPDAWHLLGVMAHQRGDQDAAIAMISKGIKESSQEASYYSSLMLALLADNQIEEALAAGQQAVRLAPQNPHFYNNLGGVWKAKGDFNAAEVCYRKTLQLAPDHIDGLNNLGTIENFRGNTAAAIECYERALELNPHYANAHVNLGNTLRSATEFESAAKHYQSALETSPKSSEAHIGLSTVNVQLGNFAEARQHSQLAIKIRPLWTENATGTQQARILVLSALEDTCFVMSGKDHITTATGNNASQHFDTKNLTIHKLFVDGVDAQSGSIRIPQVDAVYNGITDPECTPRGHELACRIVDGLNVPIINHPHSYAKATRANNYHRFKDIAGLNFPKTVSIALDEQGQQQLERLLEVGELQYPIIVRLAGTHTGHTMEKVDDRQQLDEVCRKFHNRQVVAIQFVDYRIRQDYYRRMRFFSIDGTLYPVNCHLDDDWNVHGSGRKTLMLANEWMRQEEQQFLDDPVGKIGADNYRILQQVIPIVDLEYFGIDFAVRESGDLVVFEVNSSMVHKYDHAKQFPYLKPHLDRVTQALNAMVWNHLPAARAA